MRKIILASLLTLVWAVPAFAQDRISVSGSDDNEDMLLFIEKFVAEALFNDRDLEMDVFIGELPPSGEGTNLLPDGTTIAGSIVKTGGYSVYGGSSFIYITVPMPLSDTANWYLDDTSREYRVSSYVPRGFLDAQIVDFMLCSAEGETGAYINIIKDGNNSSYVRIRLIQIGEAGYEFCSDAYVESLNRTNPLHEISPILIAPDGTQLQATRRDSGTDYSQLSADIISENATATDLLTQFEAQFIEQGWERIAAGSTEDGGFSTWLLQSENGVFSGELTVVAIPQDENTYSARLLLRAP